MATLAAPSGRRTSLSRGDAPVPSTTLIGDKGIIPDIGPDLGGCQRAYCQGSAKVMRAQSS
jgi:hypothetical protein